MAKEITVSKALSNEGVDSLMDVAFSSVVPACCSEGCQVEPDGECEHGFESVLLKEGLI
jgi:hypothetical protein